MVEQAWHAARLIPTSGINGAEEQERRATSALLAVMTAVREFGRAFSQPLGAPAGQVEAFTEVPFELGERRVYPDGLLRVARGSKSWTALVEVKTGDAKLEPAQLGDYLDIAREQGFDCLITISNEIPAMPGQHPTSIDKRKLRKVAIHHVPWTQVLSLAVIQKEHRGVADPDQAWILGELIRYLEHPRSGALEFDDMGASWVPVRESVAAGTLRANDKGGPEVAQRFDALLRYAALRLGRRLGTDVQFVLSRRELNDPSVRTQEHLSTLVKYGTLQGEIRIPNTAGPIQITADLRAGQITCSVDVEAPREGRASTRVNWLVRQLKTAPETSRVEAFTAHARGASSAELLKTVRAEPAQLISDPTKDLRSFRVACMAPMGAKRGTGRGGFVTTTLDAVDAFYADVLQHLKPWAASPPKLRPEPEEAKGAPALVSTALSSQDEEFSGGAPAESDLSESGDDREVPDRPTAWPQRSDVAEGGKEDSHASAQLGAIAEAAHGQALEDEGVEPSTEQAPWTWGTP